jgi:hypothetical protein
MKPQKLPLIALFFVFITCSPGALAQDRYTTAMMAGIASLEQADAPGDFLECAGQFERIAMAEKERWLPYYYCAYALIIPSYDETDNGKRELLLDRAQASIDHALELAPGESEIHVIQAFLYPSRILVDPMGRGAVYLEKIFASLETAKRLNPDNPRAYFMEGAQKANLPEAFGGGAAAARPLLELADEKFRTVRQDDPLWPSWGAEATRQELEKLNNL